MTMIDRFGDFEGRQWIESDEVSARLLHDDPLSLIALAEIALAEQTEPAVVVGRVARDLVARGAQRRLMAVGALSSGQLAVEVLRTADGTLRCVAVHQHPRSGAHLFQGAYADAGEDVAAADFLDFVRDAASRLP